jgi:hypothetical protein
MIKRKELRHLNYLIYTKFPTTMFLNNMYDTWEKIYHDSNREKWVNKADFFRVFSTIYQYFDKMGLNKEERIQYIFNLIQQRVDNRSEYRRKPIRVRKDNKDYINGSGYPQGNSIRYPRKCRKTAWKRFYKLFPKLDPKNEDI